MSWPYSKADVNWFVSTPKRPKTKETNWGKSKQGKDCLQLDLSLETIEIYRPDSLRYCVRGKQIFRNHILLPFFFRTGEYAALISRLCPSGLCMGKEQKK